MEFKRVTAKARTPDGYRLATIKEVFDNWRMLVKKGIIDNSNARLLDAIVAIKKPESSGSIGKPLIDYREEAQELVNDAQSDDIPSLPRQMVVYGRTPVKQSRMHRLLRMHLYSSMGTDLDEQGQKLAFNLAFLYEDIEVIHWLAGFPSIKSKLHEEYEKYPGTPDLRGFYRIVKWLLGENVVKGNDDVKSALDYASYSISTYGADHAIAIVEVILSECEDPQIKDLVYSQIDSVAVSSEDSYILLAKLLSENHGLLGELGRIVQMQFEKLFREAIYRGYIFLVSYLVENNSKHKPLPKVDGEGKTALHYAAEWEADEECKRYSNDALDTVFKSLGKIYKAETARQVDKQGRTLLHLASLHRTGNFCKFLVETYELGNEVDKLGQNFLHYAVQGNYCFEIMILLDENIKCWNLVTSRNKKGETPLHQAAMCGNTDVVYLLGLWYIIEKPWFLKEMLKQTDHQGLTPLHLAARHGYLETVQELLSAGSDPLEERDISGKTALHSVVENKTLKTEDAVELINALLDHFTTNEEKALFLWASATGIGTADEMEGIDQKLKKILTKEKKEPLAKINLLREAAKQGNSSLIWELLNRGGDFTQISEFGWVRKQIEYFSEQATDRPIRDTPRDTLGRRILAECIAAHFLNPYIKSPITVSITGGSGMGKSSLLNMIEAELLLTAAQLAFPNLWKEVEDFEGAQKRSLSQNGQRMCDNIENGVKKLLAKSKYRKNKNKRPLFKFFKKYQPEYAPVYKYLACMDFRQLLEEERTDNEGQEQSLGEVPRVLTVRFCAGNFREMNEAWAGLAVEITKEIENTMTGAQRLSTALINAWTTTKEDVYIKFILPFLVIAFLTVWMVWAAWFLLEGSANPQLKKLKYGTIPVTAISVFWFAFKAAISVFNPVSKQLKGYLRFPDHSQQLGYQQKVISDIQFLKKQIGMKPYFIFSLITGEIFGHLWDRFKDKVKGTHVPKYGSASEDKLRIIAFVDDLDHCEDEVILQVLWAINLVFRECEINVILALDKNTIERAISKSAQNQDDDFVDKFISKIIQLPVSLADPADGEWKHFLQKELGHEPNLKSTMDHKIDSSTNEEKTQVEDQSGMRKEVDCFSDSSTDDNSEDEDQPTTNGGAQQTTNGVAHEYPGQVNWEDDVECGQYEGCNIPSSYRPTNKWQDFKNGKKEKVTPQNKGLLKRIRYVRETMMQSFTDEEIKIFDRLRTFATGIQKFPREWKCYISYHKFARNVIARKIKRTGRHPSAWRLEFVAWTFVCSQWKREMNILIKDWRIYSGMNEINSLKDIVENYRQKRWPPGRDNLTEESKKESKAAVGTSTKKKGNAKKRREERERWNNLYIALDKIQDVSMEGIECFQEFRFHCAERYLSLASQPSKS